MFNYKYRKIHYNVYAYSENILIHFQSFFNNFG